MSTTIHFIPTTTTTLNTTSYQLFSTEHTISIVLAVFLLFSAIYVLVFLVVYERKMKLNNEEISRNRSKMNNWLRWLCLSGTFLALLRYIFDFVEIFEKNFWISPCVWIRQAKAILQSGSISCLYLILWLRQYSLYRSPCFHHLSNRVVRFCSRAILVIMVVCNVIVVVLYLATRAYHSSTRGCVLRCTDVWSKLPGVLLFTFTASFQTILLGLLLYPLYKHKHTSSSLYGNRKQFLVMKRVTVATLVVVLGSGIVGILGITVLSGNYGALRQVVYGFDMMVTLLAVIFSFSDWKVRLFPYLVSKHQVVLSVDQSRFEASTEVTTVHVTTS